MVRVVVGTVVDLMMWLLYLLMAVVLVRVVGRVGPFHVGWICPNVFHGTVSFPPLVLFFSWPGFTLIHLVFHPIVGFSLALCDSLLRW